MAEKIITVTWTDSAKTDLRRIYNFLAQKSESAAARQIDKILKKADLLQTGYLKVGQVEPLLENLSTEYRYLIQDHFKIIYRILPNQVVIAAVFDSRQNPGELPKKF